MAYPLPLGNVLDIIPAIIPVDLQTAANNGDYVKLTNAAGVMFVVFKAAGTDGDDPVISIAQAQDASGTGSKALTAIRRIFLKEGTLTAVTTWTETEAASNPGSTYTMDGTSAQSQALVCFYVQASDLDVENGFDWVRMVIADTGSNAQLGCGLYILVGLGYPSAPAKLSSAIS